MPAYGCQGATSRPDALVVQRRFDPEQRPEVVVRTDVVTGKHLGPPEAAEEHESADRRPTPRRFVRRSIAASSSSCWSAAKSSSPGATGWAAG